MPRESIYLSLSLSLSLLYHSAALTRCLFRDSMIRTSLKYNLHTRDAHYFRRSWEIRNWFPRIQQSRTFSTLVRVSKLMCTEVRSWAVDRINDFGSPKSARVCIDRRGSERVGIAHTVVKLPRPSLSLSLSRSFFPSLYYLFISWFTARTRYVYARTKWNWSLPTANEMRTGYYSSIHRTAQIRNPPPCKIDVNSSW